jgi:predicted ArsR family transcriptional regulator
MARKITAPQTPPALLSILVDLLNAGQPSTAADLSTNSIYMGRLIARDLIKVKDQVNSGRKGRPAHIYALTAKGRGRAKRAASKVAA